MVAGKRGQRNYAEQILSRIEMKLGPKPVASIAATFREGAPTRVTAPTKEIEDQARKTSSARSTRSQLPPAKAKLGVLAGNLKIDGKAPAGLGVVMLTPVKGGAKKRVAKSRIIEQRGRRVRAARDGGAGRLDGVVPELRRVFHNVFSISKSKAFDLGFYKGGDAREMKFDKPGIVRLGCNLHASMSAYLIVVAAPHYVVVDKDGAFSFKALAPGKYKVQVWNERAGEPIDSEIEIKEGDNAKDFDLKSVPPSVSPDKFGQRAASRCARSLLR